MRGLLAGIICAGVSALLIAPAEGIARPPAEFYGVVTQGPGGLAASEVGRARRGRVGTVRLFVPWGRIEAVPGHYSWAALDRQLRRIDRAGAVPLPFVHGSPSRFGPEGTPPTISPAAGLAWSAFLEALLHRYGPGGGFPEAHPGIEPLRRWQIWNEPNLPAFWGGLEPSPSDYVALLSASATTIRGIDPGARVILAGLSPAARGIDPDDFLAAVYAEYARLGREPDFNQVALHPYGRDLGEVRRQVQAARRVARAATGAEPRLLISEVAWGSAGPAGYPLAGTPQSQARNLRRVYRMFERKRRKWRVSSVLWYSWRDTPNEVRACGFCAFTGLLDDQGKPKPAWRAFKEAARRAEHPG